MKLYKITYLLMLGFLLQSCITEPDLKQPFHDFAPVDLNDNWEISTPTQEGIDSAGLLSVFIDFHNDDDAWQVRSLSVFRNRKIVAESYTKDESDRTAQRAFWSCTKQVTALLVGIAIDNGLIESINDKISKYLPDETSAYPDKNNITIKDLLTMQSGINYKNYGLSGDDSQILQQLPDNYLDYIFEKNIVSEPGTEFKYKDSDPQILSSIIEKVTGKHMDVWADEVLFSRIGINNLSWERYKDGTTLGSFGILSTPREMTKIAQLVLNGGTFNGERVVSEQWIGEMVFPHVEAEDKHFGYLWWSYPEHKTYFMSGNGRQLLFVFPEKELIVTITSEPNVQGKFNLRTAVGREYAQRIVSLCD